MAQDAIAEAREARELAGRETARADGLEQELENRHLQSELTRLRALEDLRLDHQRTLAEGQSRMDSWIQDVKKSHQAEKEHLLEKIGSLRVAETGAASTCSGGSASDDPLPTEGSDPGDPLPTAAVGEPVLPESSSRDVPALTTLVATPPVATHPGLPVMTVGTGPPLVLPETSEAPPTTRGIALVSTPATTVVSTLALPAVIPSVVVPTTSTSAARTTLPVSGPGGIAEACTSVTGTSSSSGGTTGVSGGAGGVSTLTESATPTESSSGVMETVTRLLKAQADAMAAQAKAVAVQHLPAFACYTGEGSDIVDDGFDRWVERFHERAKFASWSAEDQFFQLKLHLDKTALEVFRMLPNDDLKTVETVITALKKRFKPTGIEELRGLEFHYRTQGNESVEQLGISIQQLGRKAFPSIIGKDFDRLLKGRFYQALLVKWQRKLGSPKPDESFHDLFSRARMLEECEKQFAVSANTRTEAVKKLMVDSTKKSVTPKPKDDRNIPSTITARDDTSATYKPRCFRCKETGHTRQECPLKREAPGRTKVAAASAVGAKESAARAEDLTETQLEQLLAKRRRDREQSLLTPNSQTNTVRASGVHAEAVASLLELDVCIEGLPIKAMVDTGAQSTIISRSTLHAVSRHLRQQGREAPQLEIPTVHLYGKDGEKGGKELQITAQLPLVFSVDSKSVTVPVFVQPDSEQACLLGVNAIPLLGIRVIRCNGESILSRGTPELDVPPPKPDAVMVCLVKSISLPAQKCRVVRAKVSCPPENLKTNMLFEPNHSTLVPLGASTEDSLVPTCENGEVLVPVQNFQGIPVHLEAGAQLGTVRPADPVELSGTGMEGSVEALPSPENLSMSVTSHVKVLEHSPERFKRLLEQLNLPLESLSLAEANLLKPLIEEFSDIFALDDTELGCTDILTHGIDTGDHAPIKQQPYRTPIVRREKMAEMIAGMRQQGVVQPSCSPWSSPVVLVPKKDGSLRFCIDYRRLNAATKKDVYPLPRVDDILDALGEARYFSSLDLASGYWQVELDKDAREKSAFTTYNGLFEFTRMPFGLCNAPATFQRIMQIVLAGLEWQSCFVYLDDILIASKTFEQHLHHLREVFTRIRGANLRLKPRKCGLLRDEVHFLGHVISAKGILPDPAKTEKVRLYPCPLDATGVRRFLGLASYYRRFVPNFASVAAPLHALTKKDAVFQWTTECQGAFAKLKELLTTTPVLAYPMFGPGRSFILETDASMVGLGAILSQAQDDGTVHPVAYASRSVDKHEKNYGISELETLGLVWAVRYFRIYLLGHPCVVYTDHAACLSILNTARPSGKLARWALTIQEMDLTIKHKPGKKNTNADALSRCPADEGVVSALRSISAENPGIRDMEQLNEYQLKDSHAAAMMAYLRDGTLPDDDKLARRVVLESKQFGIVEDVLYHESPVFPDRWCTVVPQELRPALLEEAHQGRFAGHLSGKKVYDRLRRNVWWHGMKSDVHRHCKACLVCASRKGSRKTFRPLLHPIPVGGPFHRVAVDILQLPLTEQGNCYAAVFMDYFTKWPEAFAIPDQKATTIAKLFVEQIICRHGVPEELLSDRGANFLSTLIQEICCVLGVKKLNTSGYHPQTDGLVEKFNSTLISMIAKSCDVRDRDWDVHLPYLLFAYRVSAQESTKESPFFLVNGRDARIPTETALSYVRSPYAIDVEDYKEELLAGLSLAWKLASDHIKQAQVVQKTYYDRSAKEVNLKVGDRVMVFMPAEAQGKAWKLSRPFHGPYRVLKTTPTNAEVRLVDRPEDDSIFVALNRVRLCYPEQGSNTWTGHKKRRKRKKPSKESPTSGTQDGSPLPYQGPVTRSRNQSSVNKD